MFHKKTKGLHVYNIDLERAEDELQVFTFDGLNEDRLVTIVPFFDFSPQVKYFL